MDPHDEDNEEELEQYLKEIQMTTEQISIRDNPTRISRKKSPPPPNHRDDSLLLAFGNLGVGESSGGGSSAGYYSEENSFGGGRSGISNWTLGNQMLYCNSLPNSPGAPISSGLYSHENSINSEFRSDPTSVGLESQLYYSSTTRMTGARIMDHGLGSSSHAPSVGYQQQHFRAPSPSSVIAAETIIQPGLFSASMGHSNQYSADLEGTENVAFVNPFLATDSSAELGVLSPSVNGSDQYYNLGLDIMNKNLAFPTPPLAAERIVQPGIFSTSVRSSDLQYSNMSSLMSNNITLARALEVQANRIQVHLRDPMVIGRHQRARQRTRAARANQENPTENQQQQTRFHSYGQSHTNRVMGIGSNSNRHPWSRGHSPTRTSASQPSLQQVATQHHRRENLRYHEQVWNGRNNVTGRDRSYRA